MAGGGDPERVERGGRAGSAGGRLARLGFADPERAARLLADPALAGLVDPLEDLFQDGLVTALGAVPDPDLALLALVRLLENVRADGDPARLRALLRAGGPVRARLLAVLGDLGRPRRPPRPAPRLVAGAWSRTSPTEAPDAARAALLVAVGADPEAGEPVAGLPGPAALDALRVAYRYRLLAVAGVDLAAPTPPPPSPPSPGRSPTSPAPRSRPPSRSPAPSCRPGPNRAAWQSSAWASAAARSSTTSATSTSSTWPSPSSGERRGRAGRPRDRREAGRRPRPGLLGGHRRGDPVAGGRRPAPGGAATGRWCAPSQSHVAYYRRWAQTWEFQALLKARPVAGDVRLGEAYLDAIRPMVWRAAEREHFVEDVQAMRRRVEEHVPANQAGRQLKLGPGGLRDVEFSVQLLQLVHGRVDPAAAHRQHPGGARGARHVRLRRP